MLNGDQFLIRLLSAWVNDDADAAQSSAAEIGVDGDIVLSEASLSPVASHLISAFDLRKSLPESFPEKTRRYLHFTAANNAAMLKDLKSLLEDAKRENIPVMLLKGLALITSGVYPEKGLRLLSDMDVFTRKKDIPRLETLLDRAGWRSDNKDCDLSSNHHIPLRLSPGGFPLEAHFALSRTPINLDLERIWERSKPSEILPGACIPSVEDTIFQIALNASLHHPDHLFPLHLRFATDFAFIWKFVRGGLDWDYIAATAESAGIETPFWNTVAIASRLIEPPGIADVFRKYGVEKKIDSSFVSDTVSRLMEGAKTPQLSWLVALAAEEKNPLKRLYRALQIVFPPRSFMAEAYPQWRKPRHLPLAYTVRIFKLIRRADWKNWIMAYRAGKVIRSVGANGSGSSKRD